MSQETNKPQRGSRAIGIGIILIGVAGILFAIVFGNKNFEFKQEGQRYYPAGQRDYNNGTAIFIIDKDRGRACNAFFSTGEIKPFISCESIPY